MITDDAEVAIRQALVGMLRADYEGRGYVVLTGVQVEGRGFMDGVAVSCAEDVPPPGQPVPAAAVVDSVNFDRQLRVCRRG